MNTTTYDIPGPVLIEHKVFEDKRGFFLETYREEAYRAAGVTARFVQDNHSGSVRNVLRGLHYQINNAQAKLVRVIRGEVYDVAVDIRRGSPTFGKHCGVVLSEKNRRSFYVPEGFAHGFYVMSDWAEFTYKCSNYYSPHDERGIHWRDPALDVDWPLADGEKPIVSDKDAAYRTLAEMDDKDLPLFKEQP